MGGKRQEKFYTFAKYIRVLVIDMISLILLACILLPQICYICTDKSEFIIPIIKEQDK